MRSPLFKREVRGVLKFPSHKLWASVMARKEGRD